MFMIALFTRARTWEPPHCASEEKRMRKAWDIIYSGLACACKDNNATGSTWMGPETVTLSEAGQTARDKYHAFIYMWNLKQCLK